MNIKYIMSLLVVISIFAGTTSAMVGQEQIDKQKYVEGEVIVKYLDDKEYKLEKLPAGMTVEQAIKEYNKNPNIKQVEPNYIVQIQENVPNDPYFNLLWGLNNYAGIDIKALKAWDITTGSKDVTVAVIDTGVSYNHSDLSDNMWINPGEIPKNNIDDDSNGFVDDVYGVDFYNNDADPMDDHYHGTHVSGTIGAIGNNNIGITGVNWNVNIMAVKFLNRNGSGTTYGAIESIKYATMMNVDIMSNSWGGGGYSQALADAIKNATDNGIIFVAAAGNSARDIDISPFYPASYPNVIAVSAIYPSGNLTSFSNWGNHTVSLGAPGVNIYSTILNNSYGYLSGTSMATPHVAGTVALIKAKYPTAGRQEIEQKLLDGTTPLTFLYNKTKTGGMLNAYNALTSNETPIPVMCWDGNNTYLANDKNGAQARKFALCVSGTYEFNKTVFTKGNAKYTGYSYIDSENNNNWNVSEAAPTKHLVYGVIANNITYNTNKNYYIDT